MRSKYFPLGQKVCGFFNSNKDKAKKTNLYYVGEISHYRESDTLALYDINHINATLVSDVRQHREPRNKPTIVWSINL